LIKCKLIFVFFRQTGYFVKIAISWLFNFSLCAHLQIT
jgi:hypothetical protein